MTDHNSAPAGDEGHHDLSPFESSSPTKLGAARRVVCAPIVIGAAVAAAWWFTRAGKHAETAPRRRPRPPIRAGAR